MTTTITRYIDHVRGQMQQIQLASGYNTNAGSAVHVMDTREYDIDRIFVGTGTKAMPQFPDVINISFTANAEDNETALGAETELGLIVLLEAAHYSPRPENYYEQVYKPLHDDLMRALVSAPPLDERAFYGASPLVITGIEAWYHEEIVDITGVLLTFFQTINLLRYD